MYMLYHTTFSHVMGYIVARFNYHETGFEAILMTLMTISLKKKVTEREAGG